MRKLTKIKILIAVILLALLVASFVMRIAFHTIPDDYRPYTLSRGAMTSAAADFQAAVMDLFGAAGKVGSRGPNQSSNSANQADKLNVTISADQLNRWIAAMDVKIVRSMNDAGFSDPAIIINDGEIKFYIKWKRKNTIISLRLHPQFDQSGRMRLQILSIKMGALKIPRSWLDEHLKRLTLRMRNRLEAIASSGRDKLGPLPLDDASVTLKQLLDAARSRPVELKFPKRYGLASISDIQLRDKAITLTIKSNLPKEN